MHDMEEKHISELETIPRNKKKKLEMKTNLEGTQEWKTHHKIYSDKKKIKRQKIFKVKQKRWTWF